MTWIEFSIPVVILALLVRLEAILVGPYWSFVELIPENDSEDERIRRSRRKALVRRLALPVFTGACLELTMPDRYTSSAVLIIGGSAALLVLWPVVFHGFPIGVRARDWELIPIYAFFVGAFSVGCFLGGDIGGWITSQGGILAAARDNLYPSLVSFLLLLFFSGALENLTHRLTTRRDRRLSDEQ